MDHQPPLVFDAALRNKRILRPTRQQLPVVLPGRGECEHTQRLIARLGELRKEREPSQLMDRANKPTDEEDVHAWPVA